LKWILIPRGKSRISKFVCALHKNLFSGNYLSAYNTVWVIAMESIMITNKRKTQLRIKHLIFALLLCGVLSPGIAAQQDVPESVKPYVDKLNGFSILPPEGGILNPRKSPQTIVGWLCYDPKTKKIKWSLRVLRITARDSKEGVEAFAQTFAGKLAGQKDTSVVDKKVLKISGHDAVVISGIKTDEVDGKSTKIYFRRLWVRTAFEKVEVDMGKPKKSPEVSEKSKVTLVTSEFLLFELISPLVNRDIANSIWKKTVSSLKILDVEKTLTNLKENSERAKIFLQNLWENKSLDSISGEPSWYLVFVKDKPVGWVMMQGKAVQRNYIDGFELRLCSMRQEPNKKVLLSRQQLFVDPKLQAGFWSIYSQLGSGPDSVLSSEEGLLRGDKVVCSISNGNSVEARKKDIPREVREILLPKAIGLLFPRLVDINKQMGYTFAEYSSGKNTFNMRSFTVLGPEWIDIRGKRILAVKATDQPYLEAQPAELWLGKNGRVLRCKSANNIIESSTQQQVLRYFPKANLYVGEISKLGKHKK
jgi:hypothetical protein